VLTKANLNVYQGDDYAANVTVSNGTSAPDLSAYTARAQIRNGPADLNPDVVVEIATSIAVNVVTLTIPATDTAGLTRPVYYWDLELTAPGGPNNTIMGGNVLVTAEITRVLPGVAR
jgi:hypothetical protein